MKKWLLIVLAACVLLGMSCACAETDGGVAIIINNETVYGLPVENGQALIGEGDMGDMTGAFFRLMHDQPGRLNVQLENQNGPQSWLNLRIENLSQLQGAWWDTRENIELRPVPIQLSGAKAQAVFDGQAQNEVRRAAVRPAAAQLVNFLLRSAKAAITGNQYPDDSLNLSVAVQDWSEFKNDLTPSQEAAISQLEVLGGVRARIGMAIGNGTSPSHVNDLKKGTVTLRTSLPADVLGKELVAWLVEDDGRITQYSVTMTGQQASIATNMLGDYLIVEKQTPPPYVPATGDNAPLAVWMVLAAASAAGIWMLIRKKRFA